MNDFNFQLLHRIVSCISFIFIPSHTRRLVAHRKFYQKLLESIFKIIHINFVVFYPFSCSQRFYLVIRVLSTSRLRNKIPKISKRYFQCLIHCTRSHPWLLSRFSFICFAEHNLLKRSSTRNRQKARCANCLCLLS